MRDTRSRSPSRSLRSGQFARTRSPRLTPSQAQSPAVQEALEFFKVQVNSYEEEIKALREKNMGLELQQTRTNVEIDDKDRIIVDKDCIIVDKDRVIAKKDKTITKRDQTIRRRDRLLKERKNKIGVLKSKVQTLVGHASGLQDTVNYYRSAPQAPDFDASAYNDRRDIPQEDETSDSDATILSSEDESLPERTEIARPQNDDVRDIEPALLERLLRMQDGLEEP